MNTTTPAHHIVADLEAEDALIDIDIAVQKLQEWNNRRHGQHMRFHMARIELLKREFGPNAEITGSALLRSPG